MHTNYSGIEKETGLMTPSDKLRDIFDHTLKIFEDKFDKLKHPKKLAFKLLTILKNEELISSWIDENK